MMLLLLSMLLFILFFVISHIIRHAWLHQRYSSSAVQILSSEWVGHWMDGWTLLTSLGHLRRLKDFEEHL